MASSLSAPDNASIQIQEDHRRRLDALEGFTATPQCIARKREAYRCGPWAPERPERSRNLEPQGHLGHQRGSPGTSEGASQGEDRTLSYPCVSDQGRLSSDHEGTGASHQGPLHDVSCSCSTSEP